MSREQSPAFQFYPKDFLSDSNVTVMSLQERGAYITLLATCWLDGSLPTDTTRLAALLGVPHPAFLKFWPAVRLCFVEHDSSWVHPRLDKEREKQELFRRRQSDKGKQSAAARGQPKPESGSTVVQPDTAAPVEPDGNSSFALCTLPSALKEPKNGSFPGVGVLDPFVDAEVTERAGRFIERYESLYQEHRKARYVVNPGRDYLAAVPLCATWTDDVRLDKIAAIFLTTDNDFAEKGSRTIPQFKALASWCDSKLSEWEAKQRPA